MKSLYIYIFLGVLLCFSSNEAMAQKEGRKVDFGKPSSVFLSEVVSDCRFVPLETTDESLFGTVNQLVCYEDKIYILDTYNTHSLFMFSNEGKFLAKLESGVGGPGEFFSPHSFSVHSSGIYVLDRDLSCLLQYDLQTLKFIRKIKVPFASPLSFMVLNDQTMMYFYPLREKDETQGKQYVVADVNGKVSDLLYDGLPSGRILHGTPGNFYRYEKTTRTFPYFSNVIYDFDGKSLSECYRLAWGNMQMPPASLFARHSSSGPIMEKILQGSNEWIRLIYVYETQSVLTVKYYVKRDFYCAVWDKRTGKVLNVKADRVTDDLGIGGRFPLPYGVADGHLVALLQPGELENVSHSTLKQLMKGLDEDSNPILMFYDLKIK